jgi:methenyltetrahydromethanopterin cyclohydrolase
MHKLHELKFNIKRVVGGFGSAPLPPVAKNSMKAIGRTNDAVLYGGEVTLFVRGDDESIIAAGEKLPSSTSRDYGRPFAEVFKSYEYDFYKVDPMLFSPACVVIQNIETGKAHVFGSVNHDVLGESYFG